MLIWKDIQVVPLLCVTRDEAGPSLVLGSPQASTLQLLRSQGQSFLPGREVEVASVHPVVCR